MGGGIIESIKGIATYLGIGLFVVLFCWLLPVLVAKNVRGLADRLSAIPGVAPGGGLQSGVIIAVYPILLISLAGGALAMGSTGGETPGEENETNFDFEEAPGNPPYEYNWTLPGFHGDYEIDIPDDHEPDDSETASEREEVEYADPDDPSYDRIAVEVIPFGREASAPVDTATVSLYDSEDRLVGEQIVNETFYFAHFSLLNPHEEYTISVTNVNDGQLPPENKTAKPKETAGVESVIIEPGFWFESADSYRAVYIREYADFPKFGDYVAGGYAEVAENGDWMRKATNAQEAVGGLEGNWIQLTYTDGPSSRTFDNYDGRWQERTDEYDGERRIPWNIQRANVAGRLVSSSQQYKGEKVLEGSGVANEQPSAMDRIPQVSEAAEAHEGRTVQVYYNEAYLPNSRIEMWVYVDIETKHLLRIEYGHIPTDYDDPIWHTVDYWDHGNVETVDEYDYLVPD